MTTRQTGKDGLPMMTDAEYGDLCTLAELGISADLRERWEAPQAAGCGLTSDWARAFATIACEVLGMTANPANEFPYPDDLPEGLRDVWDALARDHGGDVVQFQTVAGRLYAHGHNGLTDQAS